VPVVFNQTNHTLNKPY